MNPPTQPRSVCLACFRPARLCYCDHLQPLDNHTRVVVIQHPREQFHPLGTARIVARGLVRSELIVSRQQRGTGFGTHTALPPGSALLYPGPRARDLASVPRAERPSTLVVLDGTWHHARTLYRDHPVLHALPQYRLRPERPTEYRVRREPHPHCISTVEAVAAALEVLEPGHSYRALLRAFRRMIDLHIASRRSLREPRQKTQRPHALRCLPRALAEHFDKAVLVHAESVPGAGKSILLLTALRLLDGCVFSQVVRPESPLPERVLGHMGLARAELEAGTSQAALWQRFRAFLGPDSAMLAWNQGTLDSLQLEMRVAKVSLKASYRRYRGAAAASGSLCQVIEVEKLDYRRAPVPGRAAERLGQAEALARHLHELGRAPDR